MGDIPNREFAHSRTHRLAAGWHPPLREAPVALRRCLSTALPLSSVPYSVVSNICFNTMLANRGLSVKWGDRN